jgi:hypothetical protein
MVAVADGEQYVLYESLQFPSLIAQTGLSWGAAALFMLLGGPLSAQTTLYYDLNDSAPGSAAAAGNWTTSNATGNLVWSTDSAGNATTSNWTNGSNAVFSAGTDGTSAFTVTPNGTPQAANVTFEEGNVTISGSATYQLAIGGKVLALAGAGATAAGDVRLANTGNFFFENQSGNLLSFTNIQRVSNNNSLFFDGPGNITVGTIANIGTGAITKNGSGTLTINAPRQPGQPGS